MDYNEYINNRQVLMKYKLTPEDRQRIFKDVDKIYEMKDALHKRRGCKLFSDYDEEIQEVIKDAMCASLAASLVLEKIRGDIDDS